jgi:hypothetical protein
MPSFKAMLITHPVRARILTALAGRRITTRQIAELLPDVPLSSIIRHVRLLAEQGAIREVGQVRVRGALTRLYTLQEGGGRLAPTDVAGADRAEQLSYLATFLNTLLETYRTHLERGSEAPGARFLRCLAEPLCLRPEDWQQFQQELDDFLESWRGRSQDAGCQRMLLAHLLLPDQPDPPRD